MDSKETDKILAFDTLFTTNHIKILKVLFSYLDSKMKKQLAVYIKYMEFQFTLQYFNKNPYGIGGFESSDENKDYSVLIKEIIPYCTKDEQQKMEQFSQMFQAMKMYQDMSQTMSMASELFPDMGNMAEGGFSPEILSSLFGADTSNMMDLFAAMNSK